MRGFWHSVALSEVVWPVCVDPSLVGLPTGLVFIYFHNGLASNGVQASGRHICVQAAGAPIFPHVFTGAAFHRHTGVQGFAWILFVLCNVGSKVGQTRKTRQTSQISTGPFVLLKFDSISSPEDCSLPNLMRSFLQHRYVKEAGLKSLAEVPAAFTQSVLAMRFISVPTPEQPNSDDCAAYLLHNMELFSRPCFPDPIRWPMDTSPQTCTLVPTRAHR